MDNRTFDEQYERAKRAAEAADAIEPRANTAYYDRASHLIVIHLRNGESFTFSPTVVEELAHGSPDELGQIEVSPSGDGLSWPALDVDLGLVSLMHITPGPAATAAMPPSGDASESLEQLYTQIEIAWMQRRAVPLVDQLAMRYPGYKDALHEFLALLVDDALGEPGAKEEIQRSVERTQEWLTAEGYIQAEQAAREVHAYSVTVDLAGATGAGERGATSSGDSDISEEAEQLALGYVGLIHQRTQLPHQQILADIGVPDVILTFAQDYPVNETPQGARREIVRLANEKYGIDEREGEEALNRMLPKVAFRKTPYAHHQAQQEATTRFSRYVEMINTSKLSRVEKRRWLSFAKEEKGRGNKFDLARWQARELRKSIGIEPAGLLGRLEKHLKDQYQLSLWPVSPEAIQHGRAEAVPADMAIRYDRNLDKEPAEKLFAIAHEFGHLVRHGALFSPHTKPNELYDSKYTLSDGAGALARYSSRDAEELEATAFAKEFTCPSDVIFEEWRQYAEVTSDTLAQKWGVPAYIVRTQLAEGLFDLSIQGSEPEAVTPSRNIPLNDRQREAAEYCGGAAIIDAGPGTGKTATLIMRVDYLLRRKKAAPDQILILTFSNEAADELRDRIGSRFDAETANSLHMHTFHSFGYSLLLSHALHLPHDMTILDEIGQEEMVYQLLGGIECDAIVRLSDMGETACLAVEQINNLKDRMHGEATLEEAINHWKLAEPDHDREQLKAQEFLTLLRVYEQTKQEQKKVDFADLILLSLDTLSANAKLVTALRKQYQWVMVDEFQDVSVAMVHLLGSLCGTSNPPWVVGDIRQAIYRFRGADPDENLRLFKEKFPGAEHFDLHRNYRSCDEVIEAANQMATLLASPDWDTAQYERFWERGAEQFAIGGMPVQVIRATSDAAEQEGIAALIEQWIKQKVKRDEIAVLARRNIDVRNIVLALGKRKIRATTSGLITPDGAAGDLTAVMTLADTPRASIPRVIYALGRPHTQPAVLDAIISALLHMERERDSQPGEESLPSVGQYFIDAYQKLLEHLRREQFSGDAFTMLCVFLFDGSDYLRRILDDKDETARMLSLSEVITTLTRAAGYRFTHPHLSRTASRLGFAQYFRDNISSSKPVLAPPRSMGDAVRVMTCHASKGLEFPCVVVAGQTLSTARRHWWLPPVLQPSADEDRKQADALLFVGLTRAERAVAITYATAKNTGGRQRPLPSLLQRWQGRYAIPLSDFPELVRVRNTFRVNALWDRREISHISARKLDKNDRYCDINTWLEEFVSLRFPIGLTTLYPLFFVAVRTTMHQIVEQAQSSGSKVRPEEAEALLLPWCEEKEFVEHPHAALYRRSGLAHVRKFAEAYEPYPGKVQVFGRDKLTLRFDHALLPVRLDLVSYLQDEEGLTHAILYRPESLMVPKGGVYPAELNWSVIGETSKRVSLVLLRRLAPNIRFNVFSAADGRLYRYKLNQRNPENMDVEADAALSKLKGFTTGSFEARVDEEKCEPCGVRISCPHWLGTMR